MNIPTDQEGKIMAKKPNGNVVYALAGRALDAAIRLEHEVQRELQTTPVLQTGNMKDIGDSWDAMYKGLIERLSHEAPEVLALTGLTSPAVQVFQGTQTLPRAYKEFPQIFTSPEKKPVYFMYAPVDYKGEHFVPADSLALGEKQRARVDDLLFAGGWLGNAPIVSIKKEGTVTPDDYKAPSKSALRKAFAYIPNDRVCFVAAGRSLEIVEDYRARHAAWEESLKAAREAIEAATEKLKPQILAHLPPGEDVNISVSYSYSSGGGDKATLQLSVRRAGKDNIWHAGKTVDVPESPAYKISAREYGDYIIAPRRNTEEGKQIAALIDAIPLTPGLRDYPELYANYDIKKDQIGEMLGVNGAVPHVAEIDGHTILIYNSAPKDKKKPFCPPGAKPFPTEAYEWLNSDRSDRNMGITPPPMPESVARLLRGDETPAKPKAPRRQPKP